MKWSQFATASLFLFRLLAVVALVAVSFMFVGWSIMSSRTSGIALVTLTAIIVLVMSALGSFSHSTAASDKPSAPVPRFRRGT